MARKIPRRGRVAHANRGKRLEKFIEACAYVEERRGSLVFLRTPPEMKILKSTGKGQFLAVFAGKGPPDYIALSTQYVYIADAKEFTGSRLPYANIHEHQADYFNRWEETAYFARSFIFVGATDYGKNFVLPWRRIREGWMKWKLGNEVKRGEASLSIQAIERYGVPFGTESLAEALLIAADLQK